MKVRLLMTGNQMWFVELSECQIMWLIVAAVGYILQAWLAMERSY